MIKSVRMCDFLGSASMVPPPPGFPAAGFPPLPAPKYPVPGPMPAAPAASPGRYPPPPAPALQQPPPPPWPSPQSAAPSPEPCSFIALGVCPLCQRDACAGHFGDNYIKTAMTIGPFAGSTGLALGSRFVQRVCSECAEALRTVDTDTTLAAVIGLLEPVDATVTQSLQALLAEHKLSRSGT